MKDEVIDDIVRALPDEGLIEFKALLDGDFSKQDMIDFFSKYSVNIGEVLKNKEVQ